MDSYSGIERERGLTGLLDLILTGHNSSELQGLRDGEMAFGVTALGVMTLGGASGASSLSHRKAIDFLISLLFPSQVESLRPSLAKPFVMCW